MALTNAEEKQVNALLEKAGFDPAEALKAVTRQHAEMRAIRNGPENQKYGAVSIVRVFPNGGTQAKCGVQVYQLRQLATDLAEIVTTLDSEGAFDEIE